MNPDSRIVVRSALGQIELNARVWSEPIDIVGLSPQHRIELCLLPAENARACFPDHWGARRFERVGALFLFPAEQVVRARSECRRQHSVVCVLDPQAVADWFDGEMRWTNQRLERGLDVSSPAIRSQLQRLAEELQTPGFASEALVELVSAQLAIDVARYCGTIGEEQTSGGLAPWRLRRIDERLSDDMTPPSLEDLARLCDMSVRQLARGFRASRGCSIGTHIADRRIDTARKLLETDLGVAEIARQLGFASAGNFATAFRHATGASPREYRHRALFPRPLE